MGGGHGYVLDAGLVRYIVENGIVAKNLLWNEDRAAGVWVEKAKRAGLDVTLLQLYEYGPEHDPYEMNICSHTFGRPKMWANNSWVFAHKVTPQQMRCFAGIVEVKSPADCDCSEAREAYDIQYIKGRDRHPPSWISKWCEDRTAYTWCENAL